MTKVAICIPSRGTMFSKTMESVFENMKDADCTLLMEHGVPIPNCFQNLIRRALSTDCEYLWFVEEDMQIPGSTLKKLLSTGSNFIGVEYANKKTGKGLTLTDGKGKVLFTGMGCLLVHRMVFEEIGEPFIFTGEFWVIDDPDGGKHLEYKPEIKAGSYGTQDIWLCWKVSQLGYPIEVLYDIPVGHLLLTKQARENDNNGFCTVDAVYV